MTHQRLLPALLLCAFAGTALATLPPPDPAAKAKAAEAAAKAAWQAKVDAFQLCKVEDRIAARFGDKGGGKAKAAPPAAAASAPAAAASASTAAASAPAAAASAPSAAASAPAGTPVASSKPPPCADPGPFAYNPPEQTPLETSGAHSPAGNAASPPSVRSESGQIQPSGKTR